MANSVTVPGGSSTVSVPPAPAAAAASIWTVEYELDLTAQAAHDFKAGGSTLSMGGVTWTSFNGRSV